MTELLQNLQENLSFILTCLLIFVGILLIAAIAERIMKTRRSIGSARYITVTAICSALAAVLMLLEIPLFFAPSFYELDLSEVPVLFCGFFLGPVAGVICELLKVVIKIFIKRSSNREKLN